ncbi:mitotic-spindle organizing gamma-tubulin ring associated-domain-containing protein [Glomus cerebriforme]|uniref:Mitotic-spindle organizing protein 1 n=1 Tax=Glomus cerebriforme TaxID=658196 RepID=A0A397T979_9GLOM|nr:mitotic-spindle organizing gamma-tubulin ring associated-domain-containing protein [Glomus cerebriforme]
MEDPKIQEAIETLDILHEISTLLNTGLDRDTLSICLNLCENGVNPEALAAVIKELRRENVSLKPFDSSASNDRGGTSSNNNSGGSGAGNIVGSNSTTAKS